MCWAVDASYKGSREVCARVYQTVAQIPFTLSATRAHLLTQSWKSIYIHTSRCNNISRGGGVVPKVLSGDVRSNLKTVPYFGPKSPIYHALSYFLDLREKLILRLRPLKLWHGSNTWSQITMNDFDLQKLTNLRRLMQNNSFLKTEWYPMPSQKENPTL